MTAALFDDDIFILLKTHKNNATENACISFYLR